MDLQNEKCVMVMDEHLPLGIIEFPVPILKGNFSDLAQGCKTYDEFIDKMNEVSEIDLNYFGIAICGAKKKVNKLTGSMPLLR